MKKVAWILAGVGGASTIVFVILLVRLITGGDSASGFSALSDIAMTLSAVIGFGLLITAIVLGATAKARSTMPPPNPDYYGPYVAYAEGLPQAAATDTPTAPGPPQAPPAQVQTPMADPVTEQAVQAVLALAGPSLQMTRPKPDVVKIQLVNVGNDNGRVVKPLTARVFAEMTLKFKGSRRRVRHSLKLHQQSGRSRSTAVHYGRVYNSYSGAFLTLDGVITAKFNTRSVYELIDRALAPIGWR